jgi:hypothetical protein
MAVLPQKDRSSKPKIMNKEASEIIHTTYQTNLREIYRAFHRTAAKYTIFSTFMNFLQNKSYFKKQNVLKYKRVEITPYIISDHNGIKLGQNNKRK